MRSILRISAAALAVASFGFASSASAATAQADATAEILDSLTVSIYNGADTLDFGSIGESGSGGTVDLSADGTTLTCSAGLVCSGTTAVPEFIIEGVEGEAVTIDFVAQTIQLTGGGDPMDVDLVSSATLTTLDGTTGEAFFTVGGTLYVNADQLAGTYGGTFDVVVAYD